MIFSISVNRPTSSVESVCPTDPRIVVNHDPDVDRVRERAIVLDHDVGRTGDVALVDRGHREHEVGPGLLRIFRELDDRAGGLPERRDADGDPSGSFLDNDVDELPELSVGQIGTLTNLAADHLYSPAVHDPVRDHKAGVFS